jgi:hypothetical protein
MSSRWARVLRGTLAAVFATGAAAVSHALAGGNLSAVGLAVSLAFATVLCVALTGKRLSSWRLVASVALSQLGFHLLFSYLGSGATLVEHGHHSTVVTEVVTDVATASHADGAMWFGHAVAATVTLFALLHGERAFWRIGQLLFQRLRLAFAVDAPVTPLLSAPSFSFVSPARVDESSLQYRGPPASLAF